MTPPDWALTLAFWLHMLATVVWIGSLSTLSLLILPVARKSLRSTDFSNLIGNIQKRFDPIAWFCLFLLLATGMVQMSANPNYNGFLVLDNRWAFAILVKHVMFLFTILISAYMTWVVLPGLRRITLKRKTSDPDYQGDTYNSKLEKRETLLLTTNLILGMIILALTAIARTTT